MVRIKEREQLLEPKFNIQSEARIIGCQIKEARLITQLNDGREVSIEVDLLTKWGVLDDHTKSEQLEKWELQNEGRYIYFPDIDNILPVWIISQGIFKSCWEK